MRMADDLELADQVFQGALERGDYSKALTAVVQCKNLAQTLFHSDRCDAVSFSRFHDRWEYYREMEREIRQLVRGASRQRRSGLFSRLR